MLYISRTSLWVIFFDSLILEMLVDRRLHNKVSVDSLLFLNFEKQI